MNGIILRIQLFSSKSIFAITSMRKPHLGRSKRRNVESEIDKTKEPQNKKNRVSSPEGPVAKGVALW